MTCFRFQKFHGLGNDFIFIKSNILGHFINCSKLQEFTKKLCDRRLGIGADGVIFYDFFENLQIANMLIMNSDGSFAANCGNALRCLGLAIMKQNCKIEFPLKVYRAVLPFPLINEVKNTLHLTYLLEENAFASIRQVLSKNTSNASVTVSLDDAKFIESWVNPIFYSHDILHGVFVQLSNPHIVLFSHHFKDYSIEQFCELGGAIQKIENVNVGMLTPSNFKCNQLFVYERGAGFTQACGTGAIAAALAMEFKKFTQLHIPVTMQMLGGDIQVSRNLDEIVLTADAEYVFSGEIEI